MKHLIALLLVGLASVAQAAPAACLPKAPADVRAGVTKHGVWVYWWCSATLYEWRAVPIASITPKLTASARAYLAGTNPDFINTPTTVAANSLSLVPLHAAVRLAVKDDKNRPPAVKASP